MPNLNANQNAIVRVQVGETLLVTLAAPATATVVELTPAGAPLTPKTVSASPTVLGPFNSVKQFYVQANNGTVTYTVGADDPSSYYTRSLAQSGVAVTGPADTAENILASVLIPGGTIGPNGSLNVDTLWTVNNNANVKTARIRLGGLAGTIFMAMALASTVTGNCQRQIWNRNSQASQVSSDAAQAGHGTTSGAVVTGTVDTSVDQLLVITGQKATAGDTIRLEAWSVEVNPGA